MSKYNKGYNGRKRKVARLFKLLCKQFGEGKTFDTMYATGWQIADICHDIPANDYIHRITYNAMGIINQKAREDYHDELLAEYWSSVL